MTKPQLLINKQDNAAEVLIYDVVGQNMFGEGVSAAGFIDELRQLDRHEPLDVRINSPGGSVFDGLTIYNLLSDHGGKVRVFVDGVAASIASVIAMSGDEITMAASARMMIHNPIGPSEMAFGTADDLREAARETEKTAGLLDSLKSTLVDIYSSRTGNDAATVSDWMNDETWLTADDAEEHGFADGVTEAKRVAACFDLSMYRNAPSDIADNANAKWRMKTAKNRIERDRIDAAARLRLRRRQMQLTTDEG